MRVFTIDLDQCVAGVKRKLLQYARMYVRATYVHTHAHTYTHTLRIHKRTRVHETAKLPADNFRV